MALARDDGFGAGGPPPAIPRLADYRGRPTPAEVTARVGMYVFMGSWAMLFAALFFAYGLLRSRLPAWPPEDLPPLPLALPAVNTLVMAASGLCLWLAQRSLRGGRPRGAARWLGLAGLLGAAFLLLQLLVWVGLWRQGLSPDGGPYPSAFYGLTVLHALHVAVGLAALAWLAARARRGRASRLSVDLWTLYWHGVGAIWLALFAIVYLV